MPIINVKWVNPETLRCEPLLVNTDHIVSIKQLEQRTRAGSIGCAVRLATQEEWLLILASLEAIEELIIMATKDDYETPSMQLPVWHHSRNKNRLL